MNDLKIRVGLGYDIHCLVENRPLILCGIKILNEKGLLGNSDGDCVFHAIADSILGALGLRDIGFYFPCTIENKNLDSSKIILFAMNELKKRDYEIGNLSVVIIAENPCLSPYIENMKLKLSALLCVSVDQIGIQVTTNEKQDSIGQGKSIASHSICSIYKKS